MLIIHYKKNIPRIFHKQSLQKKCLFTFSFFKNIIYNKKNETFLGCKIQLKYYIITQFDSV